MDKNLFKQKILAESYVSFGYKPVFDIERKYLEFERGLSVVFEKGAILTKVPDESPPSIPRFVLESKNNRKLEVSILNANFKFYPQGLNYEAALKMFNEKSDKIINYISKQKEINIENVKIGHVVKFQTQDKDFPIQDDLFSSYLDFEKPENLLFCNFEYTTRKGNINKKIKLENYEEREFNFDLQNSEHSIKNGNMSFLKVSQEQMTKTSTGIALRSSIETLNEEINCHLDVSAFYKAMMKEAQETLDSQIKFLQG